MKWQGWKLLPSFNACGAAGSFRSPVLAANRGLKEPPRTSPGEVNNPQVLKMVWRPCQCTLSFPVRYPVAPTKCRWTAAILVFLVAYNVSVFTVPVVASMNCVEFGLQWVFAVFFILRPLYCYFQFTWVALWVYSWSTLLNGSLTTAPYFYGYSSCSSRGPVLLAPCPLAEWWWMKLNDVIHDHLHHISGSIT